MQNKSNSIIEIRAEKPGDESSIDIVNCKAFKSMGEAYLVRFLRDHNPGFERKYSITAWHDGEMVGHTLFNPTTIRFMGTDVSALAVAPVAVIPEKQKLGIGGDMLRYGHELGRRNGFEIAFLAGHPSYYPAHGYKSCYGFAKITINTDKLPEPSRELTPMPVVESDISWLVDRFNAEFEDVDFTWIRGSEIDEWIFPGANALMWFTSDNKRAAYTLSKPGNKHLNMLLADDSSLAVDVISTIKPETIEHHPSGWLSKNAINPEWGKSECRLSPAAMAYELQTGALQPCIDAVESGERPPGFCNWPIWFILI